MYSNALSNIINQSQLRSSEARKDFIDRKGEQLEINTGLSQLARILKLSGKLDNKLSRYNDIPRNIRASGEYTLSKDFEKQKYIGDTWHKFQNYGRVKPINSESLVHIPSMTDWLHNKEDN